MTSKSNGINPIYSLDCRGKLIELSEPRVMGILNVTDDSFYPGSRVGIKGAVDRAGFMLKEGATFLDVGGQSTRPGATPLDAKSEAQKVVPVIEAIIKAHPEALISIDTYHAEVAKAAVGAGACMVNDISAGNMDPAMIATVAALKVPYVAMHMRGTPQTMQEHPQYDDVAAEVLDFLARAAENARRAGIADVIVDPGFGFGKTITHNFQLLGRMECLSILGRPVLVGLSRKSMIYKTLGIPVEEALNGTTALQTIALLKGAHILRVHDVAEAVQVVRLVSVMRERQ